MLDFNLQGRKGRLIPLTYYIALSSYIFREEKQTGKSSVQQRKLKRQVWREEYLYDVYICIYIYIYIYIYTYVYICIYMHII
jgi:hypothetical protein